MAENKSPSQHTAAPSAAGYLYQARLALAECLHFTYADSDIEIASSPARARVRPPTQPEA